jgi:hypothetical protein
MILEKNVKGFPKTYDIHPFPSDWKNSVSIE